jgi:hypothetical protein
MYKIYRIKENGVKKEIKHQFSNIYFIFYMISHHVENEESNYRSLHKKEEDKDLLSLLFNI